MSKIRGSMAGVRSVLGADESSSARQDGGLESNYLQLLVGDVQPWCGDLVGPGDDLRENGGAVWPVCPPRRGLPSHAAHT